MNEKKCPICGKVKNVSEFPSYYSKERAKIRIGNYCKLCGRKESKKRASKYYKENTEDRKKYSRDYRLNPDNKEKIKILSQKFKALYRENLQDCYLRYQLVQRHGFKNKDLHLNPDLVKVYKNQLLIKRKLKDNGKK